MQKKVAVQNIVHFVGVKRNWSLGSKALAQGKMLFKSNVFITDAHQHQNLELQFEIMTLKILN